MLPPICTSRPASRRMWATSAVVVDLPLVPVMATNGASGASFARSRQNSSMSPMISTPAAFASLADQCGSGWVSGTPGERISAAKRDQSAVRRSAVSIPCACGLRHRGRRCRRRRRPAPRRFSAPAPSRAPSRRARTARRCGRRRWWRGSCCNRWRTPALLILRCERSEPRRTHPDKAAPDRHCVLRGSSLTLLAPQHEENGSAHRTSAASGSPARRGRGPPR